MLYAPRAQIEVVGNAILRQPEQRYAGTFDVICFGISMQPVANDLNFNIETVIPNILYAPKFRRKFSLANYCFTGFVEMPTHTIAYALPNVKYLSVSRIYKSVNILSEFFFSDVIYLKYLIHY